MNVRYYVESDGGGHYEGGHQVMQPRTWYVVDAVAGDRIDCESRRDAVRTAKELNRKNDIEKMRKAFSNETT